jgi:hypothetical protein
MEADFRPRQSPRLARFQTQGNPGRIGAASLALCLDDDETRWRHHRRILIALLAALSIASLEIITMSDGLVGRPGRARLSGIETRGAAVAIPPGIGSATSPKIRHCDWALGRSDEKSQSCRIA